MLILIMGKDVIDIILNLNLDIVLIDFLLFEVDGIEIVRFVIDNGYNGKIIMLL